MTQAPPPAVYTVYLLHFDCPMVEASHYVGITTPPRLPARMREHAAGRGSKTTAGACSLGLTWRLARTWQTDSRALEARLREHPGLGALCPVCRGEPGMQAYTPTKNAATREWPREARSLREALSLAGETRPSVHEKREGRRALPLFPSTGQA